MFFREFDFLFSNAEQTFCRERVTLLPLQGEISLILFTLRAASLYAGLIAGCPFRALGLMFPLFRSTFGLKECNFYRKPSNVRAESPKALSSGQSESVAPSECSSTTAALKGAKASCSSPFALQNWRFLLYL